ncbi:AAA family ATPase [Azotobacter vinelandii]
MRAVRRPRPATIAAQPAKLQPAPQADHRHPDLRQDPRRLLTSTRPASPGDRSNGTHYFLSRPCRFGKSPFLDTLAEPFAGDEPSFRRLQMHDRWDWRRRHPALRIGFGGAPIRDGG